MKNIIVLWAAIWGLSILSYSGNSRAQSINHLLDVIEGFENTAPFKSSLQYQDVIDHAWISIYAGYCQKKNANQVCILEKIIPSKQLMHKMNFYYDPTKSALEPQVMKYKMRDPLDQSVINANFHYAIDQDMLHIWFDHQPATFLSTETTCKMEKQFSYLICRTPVYAGYENILVLTRENVRFTSD